jgi:hypothetical protein
MYAAAAQSELYPYNTACIEDAEKHHSQLVSNLPAACAPVTKHTDKDADKANATTILVCRNFFIRSSSGFWWAASGPILLRNSGEG